MPIPAIRSVRSASHHGLHGAREYVACIHTPACMRSCFSQLCKPMFAGPKQIKKYKRGWRKSPHPEKVPAFAHIHIWLLGEISSVLGQIINLLNKFFFQFVKNKRESQNMSSKYIIIPMQGQRNMSSCIHIIYLFRFYFLILYVQRTINLHFYFVYFLLNKFCERGSLWFPGSWDHRHKAQGKASRFFFLFDHSFRQGTKQYVVAGKCKTWGVFFFFWGGGGGLNTKTHLFFLGIWENISKKKGKVFYFNLVMCLQLLLKG